ncbi:hypothetical protein ACUOFC_48365, partial [Escherichia sp. TWPC-MK]
RLLQEHQRGSITKHVLTPAQFRDKEDVPPGQTLVSTYSMQVVRKHCSVIPHFARPRAGRSFSGDHR